MSETSDLGAAFLEHYGVKGMKWGVRNQRGAKPELVGLIKEPITRTTKNGDQFTLAPAKANALNKGLARVSKRYRNAYANSSMLTIKDKDGKKIGDAMFNNQGKDELYLNWISIEKSARGRGYASAVMQSAGEHAKSQGKKRMVLEVPGESPDARHIYEAQGFKPTGKVMGHKGDMWGGLTEMEKRLD